MLDEDRVDLLLDTTVNEFLFSSIHENISRALDIPIIPVEKWNKSFPVLVNYGECYYSLYIQGERSVDMHLDDTDAIHELYIPGSGQLYLYRHEILYFLRIPRPLYLL